MSVETWEEQRARLKLMARGNDKWDLSPNDERAIAAALERLDLAEKERDAAKASLENRALDAARRPCGEIAPDDVGRHQGDAMTVEEKLAIAVEALRPYGKCDGSCRTCMQAGEACGSRQINLLLARIEQTSGAILGNQDSTSSRPEDGADDPGTTSECGGAPWCRVHEGNTSECDKPGATSDIEAAVAAIDHSRSDFIANDVHRNFLRLRDSIIRAMREVRADERAKIVKECIQDAADLYETWRGSDGLAVEQQVARIRARGVK